MKKIFLLFVASVFLLSSCRDFLNMPPKNTKVVYKTADVKQAMAAFLYSIQRSQINSRYGQSIVFNGERMIPPYNKFASVMATIYSDDIDLMSFIDPSFSDYRRAGQSYVTGYMEGRDWRSAEFASRLWFRAFQNVGFLNAVLEDLSNVPDYNQIEGERIKGEAKTIRAYYLLKLNQMFAPYDNNDYGIPYNLDAKIYEGGARHKQTDLYKELIGELMEVLDYTTPPKLGWNVFYSKRVIYGILAQTYMYKAESCAKEGSDWENAKKYAQLARENNRVERTAAEQNECSFIPDEDILETPSQFCLIRYVSPGDGATDSPNNNYAPWGRPSLPAQKPSKELYELYDENDIRLEVYFKVRDGQPYIYKNAPDYVDLYNQMNALFRYSDLMLIEAEAMVRLGDEPGALNLLNEFKSSKIPGYAGYTGNDVLGEILKERRKEFCYEHQMRWLDMKRLGISITHVTKNVDTDKTEEFVLSGNDYRYTLPIPADLELNYNKIPQNPGW